MLRFIGLVFTLFAVYVTVRNSGCAPSIDEIELWSSDTASSDSSGSDEFPLPYDHPSRFDHFGKLEGDVSFRIRGPFRRTIPVFEYTFEQSPPLLGHRYTVKNREIKANGCAEWDSDKSKSDRGKAISIYVPVASELTLELLTDGKVIRTKTSSVPGTILTIRLGVIPNDWATHDFFDCQLTPELNEIKAAVLRAIKEETRNDLPLGESFEANCLNGFFRFSQLMKDRYGEYQGEGPDNWICQLPHYLASPTFGVRLEGSLTFENADIAVCMYVKRNKITCFAFLTPDSCDWINVSNDSDKF